MTPVPILPPDNPPGQLAPCSLCHHPRQAAHRMKLNGTDYPVCEACQDGDYPQPGCACGCGRIVVDGVRTPSGGRIRADCLARLPEALLPPELARVWRRVRVDGGGVKVEGGDGGTA